MSIKYPAIPPPSTDPVSLRNADIAIKEILEILTQQRGDPLNAAVTWQDLVDLGLITLSQVPIKLGSS